MSRAFSSIPLAALIALAACGPSRPPAAPAPPADDAPAAPEELQVAPAGEPILVRAWAEPRRLPPAGGQAQVLVLVRRKNGEPLPGVQVRFTSTDGALYSGGRILTTDESGRTRDRLTARRSATVTVDAGGTIQRVEVEVAAPLR